jgi:hypothetical protein
MLTVYNFAYSILLMNSAAGAKCSACHVLQLKHDRLKAQKLKMERKNTILESTIHDLREANTQLESTLRNRTLHQQESQLQTEALFQSMSNLLDWQSREIFVGSSARDKLVNSCHKLMQLAEWQSKLIQSVPTLCQRLISCARTNVPPVDEIVSDFAVFGFDLSHSLKTADMAMAGQVHGLASMLELIRQFADSGIDSTIASRTLEFMRKQIRIHREKISELKSLSISEESIHEPKVPSSPTSVIVTELHNLIDPSHAMKECSELVVVKQFIGELTSWVNQIGEKLRIQYESPVSIHEKFRKILCKLDEPSEVLLTLTRKAARMSHQFTERKDYIKELECKLKEATLRLQGMRPESEITQLQQKLSELELFFRKVQEQLKLRNPDLSAVIDEIARIDKARTLGALSQGRLKQTVLALCTWAQQFHDPATDQLSGQLLEWYQSSDPLVDIYPIICDLLDVLKQLKQHPSVCFIRSTIIGLVPAAPKRGQRARTRARAVTERSGNCRRPWRDRWLD